MPITWAVDLRGALVIPIAGAAMLVALASLLQRRAWKQAALVLVLFAAGWGVGSVPAHNLSSLPYRAPERQFDTQRRLTLDQFAHRDDPSFQQACGREWTSREPQVPDHATLASPCSRFVLHQNLSGLQETGTLPPSWVFWLLPLCLLPTRRRWARGSLASVLSFVGPLGALGVFALWVQVPPRYTLQFAVPLAMLAPVALLRVANLIPGRPPWRPWPGRILAAGVALFMALQVWPRATAPDSDPWHDHGLAELASWTTANIGPDDAVLECCAAALETIFLPDELHPGEPNQYGMFQPLCARYV
ncbi:MAG: hypothetical protein QGH45_24910, partial [Myxococcota bacterium]|nr:hypothetical protein [Myxococcota bacterium]